jgi:hypothetical protein
MSKVYGDTIGSPKLPLIFKLRNDYIKEFEKISFVSDSDKFTSGMFSLTAPPLILRPHIGHEALHG